MTAITPETSKLDIVTALENYITNNDITSNPKIYFSGEFDSNQTKFERASNECEVGVIANNRHIGRILLRLVRIIIDDNTDLFDLPFEIRDDEEEEHRQSLLYDEEHNLNHYTDENDENFEDENEPDSEDENDENSENENSEDENDENSEEYDLSLLAVPFEKLNNRPMNITGYVRRFQEGNTYITSSSIGNVFTGDIWDMPRILTTIRTILTSNVK